MSTAASASSTSRAALHVAAPALRTFVTRVFAAARVAGEEAACIAENLVQSNLYGHDSHGVGLMPRDLADLRIGRWGGQCAAARFASISLINVLSTPPAAPFGGRDAQVATSPICITVPREPHFLVLPGEPERLIAREREQSGIPLAPATAAALARCARSYGTDATELDGGGNRT